MCPDCTRGLNEKKEVCGTCSGTGHVGVAKSDSITQKVKRVIKRVTKK